MSTPLVSLAAATAGVAPNVWLILPFALLLLSIAIVPLAAPRFWHRWFHVVALGFAAITAGYYLLVLRQPAPLLHVALEYVSFIALIGSLYIVAGGIHIGVKGQATPGVNCLYLFIGAVLANVIGTTGASMLLIRPWLRMNKYRVTDFHVVFFIFIVSNIGGCLTPIGDPPLFLGYLKGVPFWWVAEQCWSPWLFGVSALIGVFYVVDRRNFHRAPRAIRKLETAHEEWRFTGLHNLAFIALILAGVFLPVGWREAAMVVAALGSWFTTSRAIHEANQFTFFPIKEVAWLFIGIFVTMIPALQFLELHAGAFGLSSPAQFYWLTGILSGVLDNAPTYLAFLATAFGLVHLDLDNPADMQAFIAAHTPLLRAISVAAVFFGAMTYIGNGPNFMVKAIAEHQKVETPSFLRYVVRFSLPILLPILLVVSLLFFSKWHLF